MKISIFGANRTLLFDRPLILQVLEISIYFLASLVQHQGRKRNNTPVLSLNLMSELNSLEANIAFSALHIYRHSRSSLKLSRSCPTPLRSLSSLFGTKAERDMAASKPDDRQRDRQRQQATTETYSSYDRVKHSRLREASTRFSVIGFCSDCGREFAR